MSDENEQGNVLMVEGTDEIIKSNVTPNNFTHADILKYFGGSKAAKYTRFTLAALSSLPWVGIMFSVLGAAANLKAEGEQDKTNQLLGLWVYEHQEKLAELIATIEEILTRLDGMGEEIKSRIESTEYLVLVRKAFRSWDASDTKDKREKIKKLLINAGGTTLCPDDLVRLFIDWIDKYHEAHFLVIGQVYKSPSITRAQIWDNIYDSRPAENTAEANLFGYLIRDLSTGSVIHQQKLTNYAGQYLRKGTKGIPKTPASTTMESVFEDTKPYVLTPLGSQFVHYVLTDLVTQIGDGLDNNP
jgi:hypothetical protein